MTSISEGGRVSLWDWHCRGLDSRAEEENAAYEIVIVRRGVFVRECNGTRTVADVATASFWNPGDVHRIRHPAQGGDTCTIIRFSEQAVHELLAGSAPQCVSRAEVRFPAPHVRLSSAEALRHRLWLRDTNDASGLAIEETALHFAATLVRRSAGGRSHAVPQHAIAREYTARVRELLATRFAEPLSLSQIGREVGCSPFHLSRAVTAIEGASIHRLRVRLRLQEGLRRLVDTSDSISTIALETGFASHSHFAAAFRAEFAVTPSAVRTSRGSAVTLRNEVRG